MTRQIFTSVLFFSLAITLFSSCKSNKDGKQADSSSVSATDNSDSKKTANEPASYKLTATPDTAILGKEREALVRVNDMEVVELMDADGKSTGSELTVKLSVTNKSTLDNKKFFTVSSSDARLELNNNTSIPTTSTDGSTSPDAESTSESTWKFTLPAGAKPSKLNFFLDGTRVGVNLASQK